MKPFRCDECRGRFRTQQGLDAHDRAAHLPGPLIVADAEQRAERRRGYLRGYQRARYLRRVAIPTGA